MALTTELFLKEEYTKNIDCEPLVTFYGNYELDMLIIINSEYKNEFQGYEIEKKKLVEYIKDLKQYLPRLNKSKSEIKKITENLNKALEKLNDSDDDTILIYKNTYTKG